MPVQSASTRTPIPVWSGDLFAPETIADPDPVHTHLRQLGPLVYLERHEVYAITRHTEAEMVLRDWQHYRSSGGVGLEALGPSRRFRPPSVVLEADPPHHDAPRSVLASVLGGDALADIGRDWLSRSAILLEDLLATGPTSDAVDLARRSTLDLFGDEIGLPDDGRDQLPAYADHIFNQFGPDNAMTRAGAGRIGALSAWVDAHCRREALAPTVHGTRPSLGARIWAAADDGLITAEQAPLVVRALLTAGLDTTIQALSTMLHALATHPHQYALLRSDPTLRHRVLDEAVRWSPPIRMFFRTTARSTVLAGHRLAPGRRIAILLGAAGRDPHRWGPTAAEFRIARDTTGHIGFGAGLHHCVGAHIARLQSLALLTALTSRALDLTLSGAPQRHPNNVLSAWARLPLRTATTLSSPHPSPGCRSPRRTQAQPIGQVGSPVDRCGGSPG